MDNKRRHKYSSIHIATFRKRCSCCCSLRRRKKVSKKYNLQKHNIHGSCKLMFQLALAVVISCYFFLARMSLYQSAHQTFLTSLDTVKRHYSTEILSQLDGTQISHLYYLLSSTDVILSSIDEILCLNSRRAMKTSLEEIYDHEILRTGRAQINFVSTIFNASLSIWRLPNYSFR